MQSFPKEKNAVFCKPASGLTISHQTKSTVLDKMPPLGLTATLILQEQGDLNDKTF